MLWSALVEYLSKIQYEGILLKLYLASNNIEKWECIHNYLFNHYKAPGTFLSHPLDPVSFRVTSSSFNNKEQEKLKAVKIQLQDARRNNRCPWTCNSKKPRAAVIPPGIS